LFVDVRAEKRFFVPDLPNAVAFLLELVLDEEDSASELLCPAASRSFS